MARSKITFKKFPKKVSRATKKVRGVVRVTFKGLSAKATGKIVVKRGKKVVARAKLVKGRAKLVLKTRKFAKTQKPLTVVYSGDANGITRTKKLRIRTG